MLAVVLHSLSSFLWFTSNRISRRSDPPVASSLLFTVDPTTDVTGPWCCTDTIIGARSRCRVSLVLLLFRPPPCGPTHLAHEGRHGVACRHVPGPHHAVLVAYLVARDQERGAGDVRSANWSSLSLNRRPHLRGGSWAASTSNGRSG